MKQYAQEVIGGKEIKMKNLELIARNCSEMCRMSMNAANVGYTKTLSSLGRD